METEEDGTVAEGEKLSMETVEHLEFPLEILIWADTLKLGEIQSLTKDHRLHLPRGYKGPGILRSGKCILAHGVVEMGVGGLVFRVEEVVGTITGVTTHGSVTKGYRILPVESK